MVYKILIVKNRFPQKLAFQKCYDWFKANANIDIVAEELVTDFEVSTLSVGNATFRGVVCGPDILTKLRTVVPENKYNAVVFVYGNDMSGIRVSCTNSSGPLYPNTELIQIADYKWDVLNHEMFHGFFYKANRSGVNIYDNMDSYYRNNILDTDNGDTNRVIALRTLKPYWSKICEMTKSINDCKLGDLFSTTTGLKCPQNNMATATITRNKSTKKETTGTLIANCNGSTFTCKTIELPDLNNQKMVSCIPKGTYTVKKVFWAKKLKYFYQVQNVPNRSGIFIHEGNYYFNYEGCIGVGQSFADLNKDGEVDITSTVSTLKQLDSFFGGQPFQLTIK